MHLPVAPPRLCNDTLYGQIIHIDHFGNLVSNLAAKDIAPFAAAPLIRIGSAPSLESISTTYADVAPGQPLALLGSADLLEISIRDGHAANSLQLERGAAICIEHQST